MSKIIISFVALVTIVIAGGAYTYLYITKDKQIRTACTMEAKLCPDGSYVSRTSPNCEFTPCPLAEPSERQTEFSKPITMHVNDKVIFPDGLSLVLKEINDSRCKPGLQCVWQGELSALFSANIKDSLEEVRLGTVNNKKINLKDYIFSLESATENSITIIISVNVGNSNTSGINGYIHMGPTCPVERIPPDPNCADKPYANATITAANTAGKKYNAKTDASGNFKMTVPPGSYSVAVAPVNILPRCEKIETVVSPDKFTRVDISCDTGIR